MFEKRSPQTIQDSYVTLAIRYWCCKTMKLQIQGIKSGQTIQLLDIVNIPDGAVFLEIEADKSKDINVRLERLNRLFGAWRNQPDIDLIFADMDTQRHRDYGRNIDSFDF